MEKIVLFVFVFVCMLGMGTTMASSEERIGDNHMIYGYVFVDKNEDTIKDEEDYPCADARIDLWVAGNLVTTINTDEFGYYSINVTSFQSNMVLHIRTSPFLTTSSTDEFWSINEEIFITSEFDQNHNSEINLALYPMTYQVDYNVMGASGEEPLMQTGLYGYDQVSVQGIYDYEKANYTFVEWNTMIDGSGTAYHEGDILSLNEPNMTLYAVWEVENEEIDIVETSDNNDVLTWVMISLVSGFCIIYIIVLIQHKNR